MVILATPAAHVAAYTVGGVEYTNTILVDCDGESNGPSSCGSSQHPCTSLAQAVAALENDTRISIPDSRECPVEGVVHITGYSNIAIVGNSNLTLVCSGHSSGLLIAVVEDIQLTNITFKMCGALFDSASRNTSSSVPKMSRFRVAVYVVNVTNLSIHSATFHSSTGMGLAVYNTNGNISIIKSDFSYNLVPRNERSIYPGGGGMLLHYSYCTPGLTSCEPSTNTHNNNCSILIEMCRFQGNQGTSFKFFRREMGSYSDALGRGGGLGVIFSGNSSGNHLTLQDVVFDTNSADYGGALSIAFKDNASSNAISVRSCHMQNNAAGEDGGALRIGLEFYNCASCVTNNSVVISRTDFVKNSANWGGAVEYFSSRKSESVSHINTLEFHNCMWDSNVADIAAAVDIVLGDLRAGFLPVPVFENCTFLNNTLHSSQSGILNIQSYEVQFVSYVNFSNNSGTAVYTSDATLAILNDTRAYFTHNTGLTGGALALMGSSILRLHRGSHLLFSNNTALEFGGAIYYYSTNPSLFRYSYDCFIQYSDSKLKPANWSDVNINFTNNTASGYGHAIYATTLLPCARAYGDGNLAENLYRLFTQPPFFYKNLYEHYLIATSPDQLDFRVGHELPLAVAPGQPFQSEICAYDELNQTVNTVLHTVITSGYEYASVDSVYSYTSDGTIEVTGEPGHSVLLSVHTTGPIKIEITIDLFLTDCPPGFYRPTKNSSIPHSKCLCSADVKGHHYEGILHCDEDNFSAILSEGYWAGCLGDNLFVTAQCPLGFCNLTRQDILLPSACSEVDKVLCGPRNRTGTLCGECADNFTVYYHSKRYKCGDCKHHNLGWFFYILTELLPLTLLFFVIVIFGVSFTSGPANSFIFFAQVLNFFDVTALGSVHFPDAIVNLTDIYQLIFGAFNFDFFKLDVLSFCLWKDAKILDVFIFKYITTAYAIVLLLLFILAVRFIPRCYSCLQHCVFRHAITSSLIQGISALLIITYAQCAKVSFQILTSQSLMGDGLHREKRVVFLSGETDYFSDQHLPYAIPAVFVLVLTTIPPALLLVYPALTRRCNYTSPCTKADQDDEEHDGVVCFSQWQSRLTPFLDTFQGCFKDNCRYFAGLYFIYRLAISMAFAFTDNEMDLYFFLVVIVIIILSLHAITQPYQHPFYNIVDAAIFADLAIINGLSIYSFYWSQFADVSSSTIATVSSVQVVLIYLPLLYMSVMVVLKIAVRFARVRQLRWIRRLNYYIPLLSKQSMNYERLTMPQSINDDLIPPRLFEESARYRQTRYGAATRATT